MLHHRGECGFDRLAVDDVTFEREPSASGGLDLVDHSGQWRFSSPRDTHGGAFPSEKQRAGLSDAGPTTCDESYLFRKSAQSRCTAKAPRSSNERAQRLASGVATAQATDSGLILLAAAPATRHAG